MFPALPAPPALPVLPFPALFLAGWAAVGQNPLATPPPQAIEELVKDNSGRLGDSDLDVVPTLRVAVDTLQAAVGGLQRLRVGAIKGLFEEANQEKYGEAVERVTNFKGSVSLTLSEDQETEMCGLEATQSLAGVQTPGTEDGDHDLNLNEGALILSRPGSAGAAVVPGLPLLTGCERPGSPGSESESVSAQSHSDSISTNPNPAAACFCGLSLTSLAVYAYQGQAQAQGQQLVRFRPAWDFAKLAWKIWNYRNRHLINLVVAVPVDAGDSGGRDGQDFRDTEDVILTLLGRAHSDYFRRIKTTGSTTQLPRTWVG
jgi:hypothetical protein